jgi:predicted RNA-binding Zn-ribbon protein involved in translation (DUF1610 family)
LTRRRPLLFLADLVAIIALIELALALVRSFEQPGYPAGVFFLIGLVAIAWNTFRVMRDAPTCEECGRRIIPQRKTASPLKCPQCGQPQLVPGRTRKALSTGFWAVVALVIVAVVIMRSLTMEWASSRRPSMFWLGLTIAVPSGTMLLLALFFVLVLARVLNESNRLKPVPCEKCTSMIPPTAVTGPLICPRCRLRHLPKEQLRQQQVTRFWIILAGLLIVGVFAGDMLPFASASQSGRGVAAPAGSSPR